MSQKANELTVAIVAETEESCYRQLSNEKSEKKTHCVFSVVREARSNLLLN